MSRMKCIKNTYENKNSPRVIQSILTHEQYEAKCYKLEKEGK